MKLNFKVLLIFLILAVQATSMRHRLLRGRIVRKALKKIYKKQGIKLGKKLGKGDFGTVYEAEDKSSGTKLALKAILVEGNSEISRVEKEVNVMKRVKHLPAMLPICGYKDKDVSWREKVISLELPKASGSLHDLLVNKHKNGEKFDSATKYEMFVEMAVGLHALHNKGFVHRDIKPANILIMNDKSLVYASFGMTVRKNEKVSEIHGTPGFAAYDYYVSESENTFGPSVDVYALGLTMACIDYPELYYVLRNTTSHSDEGGIWKLAAELLSADRYSFMTAKKISQEILRRVSKRNDMDKALFRLIHGKMFVPLEKRISSEDLLERLEKLDPETFQAINDKLKKKNNYCKAVQDKPESDSETDEDSDEEIEDFDSADEESMNENTSADSNMSKLRAIKVNPSGMFKHH